MIHDTVRASSSLALVPSLAPFSGCLPFVCSVPLGPSPCARSSLRIVHNYVRGTRCPRLVPACPHPPPWAGFVSSPSPSPCTCTVQSMFPPLSPVPRLCYPSPALDTLQARCGHVTLLRPWPFTFFVGPRGLLCPLGPLALLARPAPPSLLYPFPLPTLCRTLWWQFARRLQASTWPLPSASDYMRGRLSDRTRRVPTTATVPAGAAVAGCHSKCRGGRGPDRPRLPPGQGVTVPPAAPGRRGGSITISSKSRKK